MDSDLRRRPATGLWASLAITFVAVGLAVTLVHVRDVAAQTPTAAAPQATAIGATSPTGSSTKDAAALINALAWPLVIGLVLILYRRAILAVLAGLGGRIQSLSLFGVAVSLVTLRPVEMSSNADIDQLIPAPVLESSQIGQMLEINEASAPEYAIINLGRGHSWLTSYLYIFALLLERTMPSMRHFVFVAETQVDRNHFVGIADLPAIRWALAQRYPWLERAYAQAYWELLDSNHVEVSMPYLPFVPKVTSRRGAMSVPAVNDLKQRFLRQCEGRLVYCEEDIKDPLRLSADLPNKQNNLSMYLMGLHDQKKGTELIGQTTKDLINNYASLPEAAYNSQVASLRKMLVTVLNGALDAGPLYDQSRFESQSVYFRNQSINKLIETKPQGVQLVWLNRLLLDERYKTALVPTRLQPTSTDAGHLVPLEREWLAPRDGATSWRHARWIDVELIERVLGDALSRGHLRTVDVVGKARKDKLGLIMAMSGSAVVIVDEVGRLDSVLDRKGLVEAVGQEAGSVAT